MRHLLSRSRWEADEVRNDLHTYVAKHLGADNGVLIIDYTGFVKKGATSAGVQRQYPGAAGHIENCQIGRPAPPRQPGHRARVVQPGARKLAGARVPVMMFLDRLAGLTLEHRAAGGEGRPTARTRVSPRCSPGRSRCAPSAGAGKRRPRRR
ncbi:transposase [Streptomyces sp. NPDC048680]|uniref:transposase n=1 Tax=Streptomyces sp. NPDC048680 TaxID=3155492 RepID=UPI00343B5EA2